MLQHDRRYRLNDAAEKWLREHDPYYKRSKDRHWYDRNGVQHGGWQTRSTDALARHGRSPSPDLVEYDEGGLYSESFTDANKDLDGEGERYQYPLIEGNNSLWNPTSEVQASLTKGETIYRRRKHGESIT